MLFSVVMVPKGRRIDLRAFGWFPLAPEMFAGAVA
jgi:hypothetical protein